MNASPMSTPPSASDERHPGLDPLAFPTLDELIEELQTGTCPNPLVRLADPPPARPAGLFEEMLRSNVDVLASDMLLSPDRYSDTAKELLSELVAKRRPLTTEERRTLDHATLDFIEYRPPILPANVPRPAPRVRATATSSPVEEPIVGIDVPEGATSFWWLK